MNIYSLYPWFKLDALNGFVVLAIGLFFVLTLLYSSKFINLKGKTFQYYSCIILTAIASFLAVLANNLILLVIFWGFMGLTLYILINLGSGDPSAAAKKTFIIVGGSDVLMLLGIGIIYSQTNTFQMDSIQFPLSLNTGLNIFAYICIAIGCFAKAGAMPFHTWIPDCAQTAPVPAVSFILAALDKLLGIYLLVRLSLNLFTMSQAMNILLMLIGAFTIIFAVMMALVQHDMKRLLGYHSVSQVGYMVLGIGTGNPIGIAGGLFHMLNNSLYKQALFLTVGNVEQKTGTADLDKLGGLAKAMPFTYITALIASLSISGVPPFNGFFSKWMIYQAVISQFQMTNYPLLITSIFCLIVAMFGSGLTLASFMKLLHAAFLGQGAEKEKPGQLDKQAGEVSWQMWFPGIVLALICVAFGIFANQLPLKYFILPAAGRVDFNGTWFAGLSSGLIIIGLILGAVIFKLKALKVNLRQDATYTGGEELDLEISRVTGTEFYNTVKEFGPLKRIYAKAEKGSFDIYEQAKAGVFGMGKFLQYLHNGVLPTYLVWTLLGMIALFMVLIR